MLINCRARRYVGGIEQLRKRAPELAPHEVIVEMARIVALLGDGHTRLTLPLDSAPHVRTRDPLAVALDYFGGAPGPADGSWKGIVTVEHERLPFTLQDGRFSLNYPFAVRAGTKRLAGTMTANGMALLATAERR